MKLAGTKFLALLVSILLSEMSYADLRMPELAMELILKKSIHQNREIIQFEVKFTNQTNRSLSILLPGTQNKGKRLLQSCGFQIMRQEFHFYFPRCLSAFRIFERALKRLPFGAQYLILAKNE